MNRHPFSKLRDAMPPERQAANRKAVEQELSSILLAELRTQSGLTQRELAAALGISQPSLAQMEKQDDMQISTLRRLVEALGGTLDLVVKLPHGEFRVGQFHKAN